MAAPENALTCRSCGAGTPLPADLEALELDCRYCGTHQLLPERVVEQRRAQLERQRRAAARPSASPSPAPSPSGSSAVFGIIVGVIVAIVFVAIVVFVLFFSVDVSEPTATVEAPATHVEAPRVETPPVEPEPELPEETEVNNGLADVRARMNALHEAGCDRVLLPPTRRVSDTGMTAKFDPSTHCAIMIAATGMPETTVHLAATDAHGEPIDTPAAASAFEWRFCPTLAGDHRLVIEHHGPGPYHAAAYDCPKRSFAKLDPVAAPFAPQE